MKKQILKCAFLAALMLTCPFASAYAESVLDQLKQEIQKTGLTRGQKKLEKLVNKAENPEPFLFYGSELGKVRQYDQAKRILESGLKKFPGNIPLLNNLGLVNLRLNNREEAKTAWNKVLKADSGNEFAKKWLESISLASEEIPVSSGESESSSPDLEKQEEKAQQLFEQIADLDKWDIDEMESLYQKVISECPETRLAELSYWKLSNMYLLAYDSPDYSKLVSLLEQFFARYSDSYFSYDAGKRLISAYQKTGAPQKAIDFINKNFATNTYPDIKLQLVSLYEEINERTIAIQTLEQIIETIPESEKPKRTLLKIKLEVLQNTPDQ